MPAPRPILSRDGGRVSSPQRNGSPRRARPASTGGSRRVGSAGRAAIAPPGARAPLEAAEATARLEPSTRGGISSLTQLPTTTERPPAVAGLTVVRSAVIDETDVRSETASAEPATGPRPQLAAPSVVRRDASAAYGLGLLTGQLDGRRYAST